MRKGMLIFTVGAMAVMAAGCAKDDAGKNIGGETTEVISIWLQHVRRHFLVIQQ